MFSGIAASSRVRHKPKVKGDGSRAPFSFRACLVANGGGAEFGELGTMNEFVDPYGARHSFERLLLEEPQAVIDGLWVHNRQFFIRCPNLPNNPLASNGTPLVQRFDEHYRSSGSSVSLVSEVPPGAVRVPSRTPAELVLGIGDERTWAQLSDELGLILPKDFPAFRLSFDVTLPGYLVALARDIGPEQTTALGQAFEHLQIGYPFRATVDATVETPTPAVRRQGDISLRSTRRLGRNVGREAKFLNDEDGDFWVDQRMRIFGQAPPSLRDLLPATFRGSSACLVDNMGASNIRTYLSIYRRVLLVAPVEGHYERTLADLGLSNEELLQLMRLGRVQLLCPQSLDRYPSSLINSAAEAAPDALLLSRRFAAACVVDGRRRMLLLPGCDVEQRRQLLLLLDDARARAENDVQRQILAANLTHLRQAWLLGEGLFNTHGAMATLWIGIGQVMSKIVQSLWGKERVPEITTSGQNVMWAGALDATLFPINTETYSSQGWNELCASGYTGVPRVSVPAGFGDVGPVVEGLLGVENDASVVEFARVFDGGDVDRFREIVVRLAEHNLDPDFLRDAVAALNTRVQAYEGRVDHQARMDTVTAVGVLSSAIGGVAGALGERAIAVAAGCIPLGVWLAVRLTTAEGRGSAWRDALSAVNAGASRDAVLVSRLRRGLRR